VQHSTIEQHDAAPDDWEGVFQRKIIEGRVGGNVFEERPQSGDIPLTVAHLVNETALGFFGRDLKGRIKGPIRGSDAQGGVQYQEGLTHGVQEVLDVNFDLSDKRLSLHQPLVKKEKCRVADRVTKSQCFRRAPLSEAQRQVMF
jgi:hypothetical protein